MARFRFIPREEKFFQDFMAMADQIGVGARLLQEMLASERPLAVKARDMKEIEHACDSLTHAVIERLHKTFITPMDREDIHSLALTLDDVMDGIDHAASLFDIYRIDSVRFGARETAAIISRQVDEIRAAVGHLEARKGVLERTVLINRLEHEADLIHDEAVRRLYDEERDPIAIMKWKEILDALEQATDHSERVANLLEGVVVKHG